MIDFSQTHDHPLSAPRGQWVEDLNELYCLTKAAQAQAEQHGFEGMAAALSAIAATLAGEPGVDPTVVWALAGSGLSGRTGPPASAEPHGGLVTRH